MGESGQEAGGGGVGPRPPAPRPRRAPGCGSARACRCAASAGPRAGRARSSTRRSHRRCGRRGTAGRRCRTGLRGRGASAPGPPGPPPAPPRGRPRLGVPGAEFRVLADRDASVPEGMGGGCGRMEGQRWRVPGEAGRCEVGGLGRVWRMRGGRAGPGGIRVCVGRPRGWGDPLPGAGRGRHSQTGMSLQQSVRPVCQSLSWLW